MGGQWTIKVYLVGVHRAHCCRVPWSTAEYNRIKFAQLLHVLVFLPYIYNKALAFSVRATTKKSSASEITKTWDIAAEKAHNA